MDQDEIARLMAERDAWRDLATSRGKILAAYRTGGRPSGKALDLAASAAEALRALEIDLITGKPT